MNKNDKRILLMKEANPYSAIFRLSVPVVMGMMIMVLYNLVDTYFIGLMDDPLKLAASNLAMPIMMISIAASSVVATGAASYIARSLGADKVDIANKTLVISIYIIIGFSVVITLFGLIFINPIIKLLGASDTIFNYTKQYVRVMLIGTIFIMGNYSVGQLLRSEGSTLISMKGMMLGTVVNIILDPIMIFTFNWGVKGAAIATVLGNVLGLVYYIFCYYNKKTLLTLDIRNFSLDMTIFKEIFYIGIPASLEQLFTILAVVINNNLAASYGDFTIAAQGVVSKVMTVGNYIYMGFAAGSQPIMGYNYGSNNFKRMKEILKASLITTCSVELVVMCLFGLFASNIVGIFSNNVEVIAIGTTILHASMLNLPFIGATSTSRITFQSMGKPLPAFIITIIRQGVLYIPLLLILNRFFKFYGYIYAQPITEFIMMILSVSYLLYTLKKLQLKLHKE